MLALSPAGDQLILIVKKKWIISNDISEALDLLQSLISDRKTAERFAGQLELSFEGWEHDDRELPDIPMVSQWFRQLTAGFPYWFIFLNRETAALPLAINLLLSSKRQIINESGDVGYEHDAADIWIVTSMLYKALTNVSIQLRISDDVRQQWIIDITSCLNRYFSQPSKSSIPY